MFEILLILTPIALLDSTSIVPLCIVLLIKLLAGAHPVFRSSALILGVFTTYFLCGVLVLFGLQSVFEQLNAYGERMWASPNTVELVVQIVLGASMLGFGWRMATVRRMDAEQSLDSGLNASRAFIAGAGLTIVGIPAAVPYFAAVDLILRAELATVQQITALIWYNAIFVLPLVAIITCHLVFGEGSQAIFDALRRYIDRWGTRVVIVLLTGLGGILVIDGVGWFVGHPLIPV